VKRAPLGRKKPLETRAPLARSTRPRGTRERATTRAPRAPRATGHTGPSPETRELVRTRDGGRCVRCDAPAADQDHRRGRGARGTHGPLSATINGPAWLLTLCGHGNASGCHGWKESNAEDAKRAGYRLSRNVMFVDAARVPVHTAHGWALFLDDGTRAPTAAPRDDDATTAWND